MKATLIIPRPQLQLPGAHLVRSRADYRFRLRWTDHHPASHYGSGVLLANNGEVLDGVMFRFLRGRVGAWIDADDPQRVATALGVPHDEPGIGSPVAEAITINP